MSQASERELAIKETAICWYELGYPIKYIGEELLIYPSKIYDWLGEFGLESNRQYKELPSHDRLEELYHGEGMTQKELADKFEVSTARINQKIQEADFESRNQGVSP